jgi:hypothetical protein
VHQKLKTAGAAVASAKIKSDIDEIKTEWWFG